MKVSGAMMSVALVLASAQCGAQATAAAKVVGSGQVYRVTYTLTQSDGGKRVGVQHYSVVLTEGGRTTLKNGSKVPVATGTYSAPGSPLGTAQTQFTYLDVGTNLDTTLEAPTDGVWKLKTKVEESAVTEEKTIAGVNEPIVRQSVLDAVTTLSLGKPQVLGAMDLVGTTRHLDIEVVMEAVK
jgi:hypothetical protein